MSNYRAGFLLIKILFMASYLLYMSYGRAVGAQSLEQLSERIYTVREMSMLNSGDIGVLKEQTRRNTEDIRALTVTVTDVTAALNRFTGVGVFIGGIGGLIVLLQLLGFRKKAEP